MAFGNRAGLRYTPAFSLSPVGVIAAGAIPGATVQAQKTGRLHLQVLLANPALANPAQALELTQASGSSGLVAGTPYYLAVAYTNGNGSTTLGDSLASITLGTAGNVIRTVITPPVGTGAVAVYAGTTDTPLLLGTVSQTGTITYSGGVTSGLAVTINGSTLTITVSAMASSSGAAAPTSNTTTAPCVLSQAVSMGSGPALTGAINSGDSLIPGAWYSFDETVNAGESLVFRLDGAAVLSLLGTLEEG